MYEQQVRDSISPGQKLFIFLRDPDNVQGPPKGPILTTYQQP